MGRQIRAVKPPLSAKQIARLPYRRGVGVILLNRDNLVFVGQRLDSRGASWQMPQGGIDKGESPRDAALRELEEETGTRNAEIVAETKDWYSYDLPAHIVPRVWKARYRGQTQKWFALRFLGDDEDINIDTDDPEFSDWRWVAPADLPKLIVSFKRQLYLDVLSEFQNLLKK